jgi:Ca2+-binding EF-hand superfamily protein
MFNFFDKDRSGDVSRDEIIAALETTTKNKKQSSHFDGDDNGNSFFDSLPI